MMLKSVPCGLPVCQGCPSPWAEGWCPRTRVHWKPRQTRQFCQPRGVSFRLWFSGGYRYSWCSWVVPKQFHFIHWADCVKNLRLILVLFGVFTAQQHTFFFTVDCHSSVLLPQTCPKLILGGLHCSGISSKAQINAWVTSAVHLVTIFQLTLSTCYCQILSWLSKSLHIWCIFKWHFKEVFLRS